MAIIFLTFNRLQKLLIVTALPRTVLTSVTAVRCFPLCSCERNLLALDAEPQHVLPVSHIRVFLNEVYISRQQELPASVHSRSCHLLQEIFHILWWKLTKAEGRTRFNKNTVVTNVTVEPPFTRRTFSGGMKSSL